MTEKIKKFFENFNVEIHIVIGAFLVALIGDLIYGGSEQAGNYLAGSILSSLSGFLFTVFIFVTLYKLLFKRLFKDLNWMSYPWQEPIDSKPARTKKK